MKKILIVCSLMFTGISAALAGNQKTYLYKGTVDGKMPVTLFLITEDNACTAELMYRGMYQYNKVSQWLQLDITANDKGQLVLVEDGFTGVLILQRSGRDFSGTWISPDARRQLKVQLKATPMNSEESSRMEQKLEQVNYENHDC